MNLSGLFEHSEHVQEFQTGTTIFTEGTPGDVVYVILDGEVEIKVRNKHLDVLGPGEIFGEMALIDAQTRSATAVAKSPCRMAVINEKQFLYMVQQTPLFSLHVMRVLAHRLRRTLEITAGYTEAKSSSV
jgi:CRP/FNR family transcriptional regulator, cyclic AMP receptor protein